MEGESKKGGGGFLDQKRRVLAWSMDENPLHCTSTTKPIFVPGCHTDISPDSPFTPIISTTTTDDGGPHQGFLSYCRTRLSMALLVDCSSSLRGWIGTEALIIIERIALDGLAIHRSEHNLQCLRPGLWFHRSCARVASCEQTMNKRETSLATHLPTCTVPCDYFSEQRCKCILGFDVYHYVLCLVPYGLATPWIL
ncbi:hypothetical protein BR93DRAFT_736154 [Coniochaeta sp. PMI_546]|nr:hypothetical protein BR93DRAFT_736154 [Coniochaeta sp. PMI_546]